MKQRVARLALLSFLLLAPFALTGCAGSGGGGIQGPSTRVQVFDRIGGQPLPNVRVAVVTAGATGPPVVTDASGQAVLGGLTSGSSIEVNRPDQGQNLYQVSNPGSVQQADLSLFIDPISALVQAPNQGVSISPSTQNPAGKVLITAPVSGTIVLCNSSSSSTFCRFNVQGTADPVQGQLGSAFHAYVLVHPTNPNGLNGVFPQFPELTIDPSNGNWSAEVQVGPTAMPGNQLEITAVVTSVSLPQGPVTNPTQYPRPLDVPGVVFIAPFVQNLTVGVLPAQRDLARSPVQTTR